jgi:hypothetical protein
MPSEHLLAWLADKPFAKFVDVELETEKFRNHFLAKAGKDATKRNWDRTWQNWMIEAGQRGGRIRSNGAGYTAPPSTAPVALSDDQRCPEHRGERREHCRQCAAIAKARPQGSVA